MEEIQKHKGHKAADDEKNNQRKRAEPGRVRRAVQEQKVQTGWVSLKAYLGSF